MKKALQLASVASMIDQFIIPNIHILQSLEYKVDVVADFTNPGTITKDHCDDLKQRLQDMNVKVFDVEIPRTLKPNTILSAYHQVEKLIEKENYNLIHCHSPIGGAICRLAAKDKRKTGTKVIYTAHGFHFYDGAPISNWILYYPIEKILSKYTDALITINKEDYTRAVEKFKANHIVYIPGVGVDTKRFSPENTRKEVIRKELGIDNSQILLLSVGELNKNKNHESVIRAISGLNYVYVIVGKGEYKQKLEDIAKECGVDVRLTGFRNDVADFYAAADAYVLPSKREGLNVSLMEAMASGLPVACGNIRGNTDLINNQSCLFKPTNTLEIKRAITTVINNREALARCNAEWIQSFDLSTVEELTIKVYQEV